MLLHAGASTTVTLKPSAWACCASRLLIPSETVVLRMRIPFPIAEIPTPESLVMPDEARAPELDITRILINPRPTRILIAFDNEPPPFPKSRRTRQARGPGYPLWP